MTDEITSVDAYLAAQPEAARAQLAKVRAAIRRALPKATESISYKIPTYRIGGEVVIYFAGWKAFYSIYPASNALLQTFAAELTDCKVVKHTIRFRLDRPVPERLIERIAVYLAEERGGR